MHYRMLVTLAAERGETSFQARHRVFDLLMDDPSFCGDGGRFGCPVADWFVIGGRWSGCLAQAVMPAAYRDRLKSSFPALAGEYNRDTDVKTNADALDALWREYGGTGPSAFNRSGYEQLGYDDDAVLLTADLYRALLAGYAGEAGCRNAWQCEFTDLDDEPLHESFAGRKWLVVVDYHN